MKNAFLLASLLAVGLVACKDDDTTDPIDNNPPTTAQMIQHQWEIESILDYNYKGANTELDYIDTIHIGTSGEYMNFKSNNVVVLNFDGDLDSTLYSVVGDDMIKLDGDTFKITTLTNSEFEFRFEDREFEPYYDNVVRLKR